MRVPTQEELRGLSLCDLLHKLDPVVDAPVGGRMTVEEYLRWGERFKILGAVLEELLWRMDHRRDPSTPLLPKEQDR